MADGKYSIDDILNEYSGNSGKENKKSSDIDIDNILNSYDEKPNKISSPNYSAADGSSPTYERDSDVGTAADEQPESFDVDDNFAKKYGRLSQTLNSAHDKKTLENYTPEPKPNRSFSEKMEQADIYGDEDREEEEKESKAGLFKRDPIGSLRKKSEKSKPEQPKAFPPEPPIQSAAADTKKTVSDPFEKYSEIENKNLDDILNEYSEKKKKNTKTESTVHRGITDLFTKLIPKQDADENGITGNTELLDGMMKAKRERLSRTQHVAPIERTSILDIDLNLDDKIIPDTSQIPIDTEQHELDKISALKERRSKKIKDFILVGEEEDVSGEEVEDDNSPKVIDDFESFDDAASIAHDIAQLKGSLILRLVVLIICFAASAYIAIANDMQNLPIMELLSKRTQTSSYLFVNAILGLLAAFSSYTVISCGLSKILSLKADCDSLCAISTVTSIVTSMIMFANENLVKGSFVHIYIPVAIASLLFNTIGKLLIVSRTQRSFKFVSGSSEKYAIFPVTDEETAQNFTRGTLRDFPNLSAMRKTEFLSEFLKTSYANDSTDSFCRIFTPVVIAVAIVIAVVAGIVSNPKYDISSIYIGISVFVGVISICTGFSMMLVVNVPMMRAEMKGSENQGVVLGFDCIEEFAETNSVLVDANQLFPQGSVKLAAIKVFSDTRIDEAIVEAASLTTQAGSILKNMFYDIIAGKTELLNPVESYIFEDSMGLCGWINNKRVLLGNRELMVNHSIEGMPPLTKEKEYTENGRTAVYLSISGELSAMFLVEVTPTLEIIQALQDLQKNDVYIMIRSVDSIVSINRLSELFEISPEYLKLIPFRVHEQFNDVTSYQEKQRASLACSGKFAAFASLILSCKHMKGTINVGIGIQAVSMLLGIIICLVMVILNSFQELSVSMFLTYNLIFTAVLIIFQLLRKN